VIHRHGRNQLGRNGNHRSWAAGAGRTRPPTRTIRTPVVYGHDPDEMALAANTWWQWAAATPWCAMASVASTAFPVAGLLSAKPPVDVARDAPCRGRCSERSSHGRDPIAPSRRSRAVPGLQSGAASDRSGYHRRRVEADFQLVFARRLKRFIAARVNKNRRFQAASTLQDRSEINRKWRFTANTA